MAAEQVLGRCKTNMLTTVSWADHAIWWQVYPLGFVGAEAEALPADREQPIHRLTKLIPWLDYAVTLGCSGLLLGPIFTSGSHGYDTIDHYTIDPRLGTEEDFAELVAACQQRGLHILLDGVFNHVGTGFAKFQSAISSGTDSDEAKWFRLHNSNGDITWDCFEGHQALVELNHDEPAVAEYVADVMTYWCDRGASGWRLDAAYAVPAPFWQQVLPQLRQKHPDSWCVGEVIHGDYSGYVAESGLDSLTQYELWKATWSALNDLNFYELAHALGRHDEFAETFLPLTFVGNHDVTRIASKLTEPKHLGHALAVLFTVAGSPSIYYGDEQAMTGIKEERIGGDDAVRPEFPASPDLLQTNGDATYRLHQQLIALRRRHSWLSRSRTEVFALSNNQLAYTSRADANELIVLLNTADEPFRFDLQGNHVIAASSDERGPTEGDPAIVEPNGWTVLTSS